MRPFFVTSSSSFDLRAALLAGHAQHPVIVHFPIALFIASVVFDAVAVLRKQPALGTVAYFNLIGAAITVPVAILTGLAAWRWQLEGATLKGNLQLHLIFALTSAALIIGLCWARARFTTRDESPRICYFVIAGLGLLMVTLTGHLGGILSGVEVP